MHTSRVVWIDIAKGVCILAVVMLYAVEGVEDLPIPGGNWLQLWVAFARPFRMPDFFLISGLFLSRVIERPLLGYLDGKVVHYLYFFALWTLIYFTFLALFGRAGPDSESALARLVELFFEPYAMLWFLQMLALYFLLTRLLRRVPGWVVLPLALLWQMFPSSTQWHQFDRVGERFVYFYAGYAFAPFFFGLAERARRSPRAAVLGLLAWTAVNGALVGHGLSGRPGIGAALGFSGAGAVIALSSLLSGSRLGALLGRLGERSIVIYLSFLLPMTALLLVAERLGWPGDRGTLALSLSLLSVLSALTFGRLASGTALRFLFERPSWAVLRARRPAAASFGPATAPPTP